MTEHQTTPSSSTEALLPLPEDKESFEGQRILVIGGPDAHGVSMAVASAQYLIARGAQVGIYVGSPVIKNGEGATHPGAFYAKTLPNIPVAGIDRVVITDIPLDSKNLAQSAQEITNLAQRLTDARGTEKGAMAPLEHPVLFLDHHNIEALQTDDLVLVKSVREASACRLGNEPSKIARIGAICDRDAAVLPITEEEMLIAKGLDAAVRPNPEDVRPALPKNATEQEFETHQELLRAWEDRAQDRLEEAVRRLQAEDWEYFTTEAEKIPHMEIPTASGFGQVALIDTQGLTGTFSVLKLMEMAVVNNGADNTPYAIAVLRQAGDDVKMGREPADLITVIRYWTREDLPSVEQVIAEQMPQLVDTYRMYGAKNAKTVRLPVNDRNTAQIVAQLVEAFAGREMPDFSGVRSVVMCGDPNSGKSVYSTIFREALQNLGVKVAHLDLDKAAPTPTWYLDAEIGYKEAEELFSQGKLPQEKLDEARRVLEQAAEQRRGMKRPWSIELAEEAKQELMAAAGNEGTDFVIGDIGGGRIKKDENGKIVSITRLTAENARILEGADAVIIVSNNPEGAAEWRRLIETGIDSETGVRIQRDGRPRIKIIGMYKSVLQGNLQRVAGSPDEAGVITNLDRGKAGATYNPSIFATATFVSRAVEKSKNGE